ncbi:MAG: hypothetical protein V4555_02660 [Acidobacteriota bacterium]
MRSAPNPMSSASLRRELSARNVARAAEHDHDLSYGTVPSVIYAAESSGHGNFLAASYRRITADPQWSARLQKAYTADEWVPRAQDRRRSELDCAASSDALLMNVFCYPGLLRRSGVCALLGIEPGWRPEFGVRAGLPMRKDEVDRTEIDMRVGDLLVEAKLTETGFGRASRERVLRYDGVAETFDLEALPWGSAGLAGYQLVRGVLAAQHHNARFLLLCDGRRADLHDTWLRVLGAVRSYDLRSRMGLLTWQELASVTPPVVQRFLGQKYGILVR